MTILFQAKFLFLAAWLIITNVSVANAEKTIDLEILKEACESIGFTPKTEKFGECVLKLSERKDLRLVKIESTKKSNNLPSHCSELYGCPPEKYDQEIEAERRYAEETIKCHKRNKWMKDAVGFWNACGEVNENGESYKSVKKGSKWNEWGVLKSEYSGNSNNSYSDEGLGNFIEDLLTIGIVIGGAYLLGTALTPATPPPVGTTNIFTTIIQEGPKYGSPLGY